MLRRLVGREKVLYILGLSAKRAGPTTWDIYNDIPPKGNFRIEIVAGGLMESTSL